MANREAVRTERTKQLIADFAGYLGVFERQTPFMRAGQWTNHKRTIELRRSHGSAVDAISSSQFIDALRATLNAWGIGIRGSKLADRERFADELDKGVESLRPLDGVHISTADDTHREAVWKLIQSLDIVDNQARIVALTKTLHHVLPDLVMPIDRAYTGTFLGWHIPEFQHRQQDIFESGWELSSGVARSVDLERFVGSGPWHTSITKVIDNAVVGYCIAERLVIPASGRRREAPVAPQEVVPRGETWTLAELELELEGFAVALEDAGLRANSIETYVGRADTFLRWLAGTYEPRGPNDGVGRGGRGDQMPEPTPDGSMSREERIKWARRQAADQREEIIDRHEKQKADAAGRVRLLRSDELRDRARRLDGDGGLESIGPVKDPVDWANARRACRDYVIDSVRRDRQVNYDELRVLTYEVTGMTLGHSMFARMCEEINEDTDGCLLSSWVVTQETGRPGSGFFEFARSKRYDLPLEIMQRQVREHFQTD